MFKHFDTRWNQALLSSKWISLRKCDPGRIVQFKITRLLFSFRLYLIMVWTRRTILNNNGQPSYSHDWRQWVKRQKDHAWWGQEISEPGTKLSGERVRNQESQREESPALRGEWENVCQWKAQRTNVLKENSCSFRHEQNSTSGNRWRLSGDEKNNRPLLLPNSKAHSDGENTLQRFK